MIPEYNVKPFYNGKILIFPKEYKIENKSYSSVFISRLENLGYADKDSAEFCIECVLQQAEEESYYLFIDEYKITIKASGGSGFYYALITLYQLIASDGGRIKCGEYADKPRYRYRGIMLDCSRHFFNIEEVKKIIEQMSLLKLNKFHWHLSDDQGWRIESMTFPLLNTISSYRKLDEYDPLAESCVNSAGDSYGGYYTQDEIKEVVRYAEDRFVEVIPEIDLPGHSTAILAAYNHSCRGEKVEVASTFGVHERIFCAGNEQSYQFIFRLLDEIAPLFKSKYFHIGGDEAPKDEWKSCILCQTYYQYNGLKNYEQVQRDFTNKIIHHLKTLNKTAIVWNDSVQEEGLDKSAIVQYWAEMGAGESYCLKEANKDRKFIFSSQNAFYCDYSYAETPLKVTLEYMPQIQGTAVPDKNVIGIEAPMWTEWIAKNADMEKLLYPRMLAVAECCWTVNRNYNDFTQRVKKFLSVKSINLLTATPWEQATVRGEDAYREAAKSIAQLSIKHGEMAAKRGKTARAVTPDTAQEIDPDVAAWLYMKEKLGLAYTDEQIKIILKMVSEYKQ